MCKSSLWILQEFNMNAKPYMEDIDSTLHFFSVLWKYVPGNCYAPWVILSSNSGVFVGNGDTNDVLYRSSERSDVILCLVMRGARSTKYYLLCYHAPSVALIVCYANACSPSAGIAEKHFFAVGWDIVVGIATRHAPNDPGILSRSVWDFPHPSRIPRGPPNLPYNEYRVTPAGEAAEAWP
jgi:hypothetical protein